MSDKPADQRAPEPRYQALVRKWREGRVMTNLGIDMQLHGGIGIAKLCADELERLAAAEPREGAKRDWAAEELAAIDADLDELTTKRAADDVTSVLARVRRALADRPAASQGALREAAERVLRYVNIEIDQFTRDVRALALAASQPPQELEGLREALEDVVNERDTELDMMHCKYLHGTPENEAWHGGVKEAWKRFEIVQGRARAALTRRWADEQH